MATAVAEASEQESSSLPLLGIVRGFALYLPYKLNVKGFLNEEASRSRNHSNQNPRHPRPPPALTLLPSSVVLDNEAQRIESISRLHYSAVHPPAQLSWPIGCGVFRSQDRASCCCELITVNVCKGIQ